MKQKPKVKPLLKLADDFLDLRTADTNLIIQQLEENMKIRNMPLEQQLHRRGFWRRH
ncbi:MAG: hypothetical protein QXT19_03585 [Candidatus Woesearchaeota archaeon]